MQEEVTRKTIALAIKTAKLDGKVLQAALRKLLQLYRKARDTPHRGKQTLKQLMRHGTGVSNIEITDANIKAFESTAKKYGIDFALKKADDRYLVFFKGRDADVLTAAFRLAQGADLSAKLLHIGQDFSATFASAAPSFHPTDLLIGLAAAVIIRLVVYSKQKNAKKYRKGMEYDTARWGTAADIKPFIDPVFDNNVLLTQTERLMMSNRPKDPKNARNKNILVIGGSGSGKTRFFCKPNIMQLHSSYVITDPKGSLICEVGQLLQRAKYRIAVLNTINFSKSMHYNPFAYLRTEKDILKLVNTIIVNTKGEGAQSTKDFWVKAERLYYTALIGYIHYEAPEEEKNFITLLDMINASDTREDDEDYKNPVDLLFDRLEEREPEHFAVKQYRKYKLAAGVIELRRTLHHYLSERCFA